MMIGVDENRLHLSKAILLGHVDAEIESHRQNLVLTLQFLIVHLEDTEVASTTVATQNMLADGVDIKRAVENSRILYKLTIGFFRVGINEPLRKFP